MIPIDLLLQVQTYLNAELGDTFDFTASPDTGIVGISCDDSFADYLITADTKSVNLKRGSEVVLNRQVSCTLQGVGDFITYVKERLELF